MTGIVMLGAPGVGKGTQAAKIVERLGIPAISTGNIFRTNIKAGTELGLLAKKYIDQGTFVPDSVTTPMVAARFTADDVKRGFLLDGYPRNLAQAHSLRDILAQEGLALDLVIELDAPEEVLVNHMMNRAKKEGRSDDKPEVFARRLAEYRERTEPIATYYADQDLLAVVDGVGTIDEVTARIFDLPVLKGH